MPVRCRPSPVPPNSTDRQLIDDCTQGRGNPALLHLALRARAMMLGDNARLMFLLPGYCMTTPQPPEPLSHTTEMVIATVVGVAIGIGMDNLLLGCGVGIGVGIVLSIGKTLYVDYRRRRSR